MEDMEAGMAKLFAFETAMRIVLDAVRIHGGYGCSVEFDVRGGAAVGGVRVVIGRAVSL